VEKFIGDAVMAVFGAPVAHEDDAERAVRAALRILEAIAELNENNALDLSVRAAVNTAKGSSPWKHDLTLEKAWSPEMS
jgi:class 3 adenylate cyclase